GPQPAMNETGPIPASGGHPNTGPMPAVQPGDPGRPGNGRPPADGPYQPGDGQPPRRPGELPVRRPGAQLPARPADGGQSTGLLQPRSERQDAATGGDGSYDGAYDPGGPQSVVPEAQPMVPEQGAPRIPWETGPLEQVGGDSGQRQDPYGDAPQTGSAPGRRASRWETGEMARQGRAGRRGRIRRTSRSTSRTPRNRPCGRRSSRPPTGRGGPNARPSSTRCNRSGSCGGRETRGRTPGGAGNPPRTRVSAPPRRPAGPWRRRARASGSPSGCRARTGSRGRSAAPPPRPETRRPGPVPPRAGPRRRGTRRAR